MCQRVVFADDLPIAAGQFVLLDNLLKLFPGSYLPRLSSHHCGNFLGGIQSCFHNNGTP